MLEFEDATFTAMWISGPLSQDSQEDISTLHRHGSPSSSVLVVPGRTIGRLNDRFVGSTCPYLTTTCFGLDHDLLDL